MKDFLNLLGKFMLIMFSLSIISFTMWNYIIVRDLGIGKEVENISSFFGILLILSTISLIRKDLNIFSYIKYTTTWFSIIGSFLISMFILWMMV